MIDNATFAALMRLLDDLLNVLFWMIGTAGVGSILALPVIYGMVRWSRKDERIAMPPTSAEVMQAERDMNSVRAALTECEPSVRRVRAGGL